ncbi:MAG: hypothetical protein GC161_05485 [Planctomycetaceae bacterium]|nr:hypothetical protein [Planctomycetaceae bacterium]
MSRSAVCALALVSFVSGIGCISPAPPPETRFYAPPVADFPAAPADAANAVAVRLLPVRSAAQLREPMAWSSAGAERGQREYARWSERPSVYVERSLRAALLARGDLVRTESLDGARLAVELLQFEERRGGTAEAVVVLWASLSTPAGELLLDQPFEEVRALEGRSPTPESLALALGPALDRAVQRLLDAAASALADS